MCSESGSTDRIKPTRWQPDQVVGLSMTALGSSKNVAKRIFRVPFEEFPQRVYPWITCEGEAKYGIKLQQLWQNAMATTDKGGDELLSTCS